MVPKMWAEDAHQLRLALECSNLVMNCEMKLRASMMRKESRGTHYREDYPTRDNDWFAWILIQDKAGEMELTKQDIPEEWKPDLTKSSEELYLFEFPVYAEEGEE